MAISAHSATLVQMFEVALARRMCCSRVCSVSTKPRCAVEVDGGADEAAGHAAHELVLGGEHAEVGAAEAERHAEPLPLAHDDVGAERARRLQHAEVHRIG